MTSPDAYDVSAAVEFSALASEVDRVAPRVHGDHSRFSEAKKAAEWAVHLARFWVGTTLIYGSSFGRRQLVKAGIRAKVEHPSRVIKCHFGFAKGRYRGLANNTARLQTLFALSNLWMVRGHLLQEMTG